MTEIAKAIEPVASTAIRYLESDRKWFYDKFRVRIGEFSSGVGVDFMRDGRTNKWREAKKPWRHRVASPRA